VVDQTQAVAEDFDGRPLNLALWDRHGEVGTNAWAKSLCSGARFDRWFCPCLWRVGVGVRGWLVNVCVKWGRGRVGGKEK
jgi:hypothetical protein